MLAGIVGALAMTFSGHLVDLFDGNVTTMLLLMIPIPKLIATLLWLPLLKTYPGDVAAVRQKLSERREEIISQREG